MDEKTPDPKDLKLSEYTKLFGNLNLIFSHIVDGLLETKIMYIADEPPQEWKILLANRGSYTKKSCNRLVFEKLEWLAFLKHYQANEAKKNEQFFYSTDFTSLIFDGNTFEFKSAQITIIKFMFKSFMNGIAYQTQKKIIEDSNCGLVERRLDKAFRIGRDQRLHPAFGTLIEEGNVKGTYGLNLRPFYLDAKQRSS